MIFLTLVVLSIQTFAQKVLIEADGKTDSKELINSYLDARYQKVIETSEQCGPKELGPRVTQVFDESLGKHVFSFKIYKDIDSDRCKNPKRQRLEIKAYDKSPEATLGVLGERLQYKWKFKLDEDFQPSPSFTHLHQLKAVGGKESKMPNITLTARTREDLELRFSERLKQITLLEIDLLEIKGEWVEVTETVLYGDGTNGEYEIEIKRLSDGVTVMYYANNAIRMWKTDAKFIRPKWGIYRNLNKKQYLRDEELLFADFSIEDVTKKKSVRKGLSKTVFKKLKSKYFRFTPNVLHDFETFTIFSEEGEFIMNKRITEGKIDIKNLSQGVYFMDLKMGTNKIKSIKFIKK